MGTNVGTSSKDLHIMELLSSLFRLLGSKVRVQVKVSRDYGQCLAYVAGCANLYQTPRCDQQWLDTILYKYLN